MSMVDLGSLFELVDAHPFRPFEVEIVSGRRVHVDHPGNVPFIPGRERVKIVIVYHSATDRISMIYPDGIAAYHIPTAGNGDAA